MELTMNDVDKVWFAGDHIYLRTKNGDEKGMPLRWFPACKMQRKQKETIMKCGFGGYIGKTRRRPELFRLFHFRQRQNTQQPHGSTNAACPIS